MLTRQTKKAKLEHPATSTEIKDEKSDLPKDNNDKLFINFLAAVKANNKNEVDRILNYKFDTAQQRANFGNQQDEDGNTAYHHAAMLGYAGIITILNSKKAYKGKQKLISFVLENNNGEKPLDCCCAAGNYEAFKEMWKRINKPQHNPAHALPYAIKGGNEKIIQELKNHPKIKNTKS